MFVGDHEVSLLKTHFSQRSHSSKTKFVQEPSQHCIVIRRWIELACRFQCIQPTICSKVYCEICDQEHNSSHNFCIVRMENRKLKLHNRAKTKSWTVREQCSLLSLARCQRTMLKCNKKWLKRKTSNTSGVPGHYWLLLWFLMKMLVQFSLVYFISNITSSTSTVLQKYSIWPFWSMWNALCMKFLLFFGCFSFTWLAIVLYALRLETTSLAPYEQLNVWIACIKCSARFLCRYCDELWAASNWIFM